jgi:pimeloyl-ACP methyl ester carboxylesterase
MCARLTFTLLAIATSAFAFACAGTAPQEVPPQPRVSEFRLTFDEQGHPVGGDTETVQAITSAAKDATDVFIFSHGWWNNSQTAECRYRQTIDGVRRKVPSNSSVRAVLVGIYWPSAVFPIQKAGCDAGADPEEVQEALVREKPSTYLESWALAAFPTAATQGDFRQELSELTALLEKESAGTQLAPQEARRVTAILQKWRDGSNPSGQFSPDVGEDAFLGTASEVSEDWRESTGIGGFVRWLNFANAFTFWTMKERAGVVGSRGVFDVLARLQTLRSSGVKLHLIGHSFGSKLLAAALTGHGRTPPNHVDSFVLLQGAFSHFAFSTIDQIKALGIKTDKPGLYEGIVQQQLVEGPIVVTHTMRDRPLRSLYPMGVRISGDYTEAQAAISKWGALGADGVQGPQATTVVLAKERLLPGRTGATQLFNADGNGLIGGHSDFDHEEVYQLIWDAAVRR